MTKQVIAIKQFEHQFFCPVKPGEHTLIEKELSRVNKLLVAC
jgi:hypothetical protein